MTIVLVMMMLMMMVVLTTTTTTMKQHDYSRDAVLEGVALASKGAETETETVDISALRSGELISKRRSCVVASAP